MNDELFLAVRKNLDRRKRRQRAWPEGRREFEEGEGPSLDPKTF